MLRVVAVILALAVGACSNGTDPTTTSTAPPPSTTEPGPATTRGSIPPFVEVTVEMSEDGTHLVDAEGMALYRFTLDTDRTPTCLNACAEVWPAFYGDPVAGDGVDPDLLGNGERPDGSIQVTYGGLPLYYYSGDDAPGDINGHGFNDVWYLVGPDGTALDG